MNGVDWKSKESTVLPLIQAIEDSYPSGFKRAIKTLAQTAFAISKSSPALPDGIKDETDKLGKAPDEGGGDFGAGAFQNPEADAANAAPKTTTAESRRRR